MLKRLVTLHQLPQLVVVNTLEDKVTVLIIWAIGVDSDCQTLPAVTVRTVPTDIAKVTHGE